MFEPGQLALQTLRNTSMARTSPLVFWLVWRSTITSPALNDLNGLVQAVWWHLFEQILIPYRTSLAQRSSQGPEELLCFPGSCSCVTHFTKHKYRRPNYCRLVKSQSFAFRRKFGQRVISAPAVKNIYFQNGVRGQRPGANVIWTHLTIEIGVVGIWFGHFICVEHEGFVFYKVRR